MDNIRQVSVFKTQNLYKVLIKGTSMFKGNFHFFFYNSEDAIDSRIWAVVDNVLENHFEHWGIAMVKFSKNKRR